jgi:hypothetical protein
MAAGAITIAKLWCDNNELAYSLALTGGTGDTGASNLDGAGAATPDLATDSVGFPGIHNLMTALYANQADCRATFGHGIVTATVTKPLAEIDLQPRDCALATPAAPSDAAFKVDCDVTGPGAHPRLVIRAGTAAANGAATAILRIRKHNSLLGPA